MSAVNLLWEKFHKIVIIEFLEVKDLNIPKFFYRTEACDFIIKIPDIGSIMAPLGVLCDLAAPILFNALDIQQWVIKTIEDVLMGRGPVADKLVNTVSKVLKYASGKISKLLKGNDAGSFLFAELAEGGADAKEDGAASSAPAGLASIDFVGLLGGHKDAPGWMKAVGELLNKALPLTQSSTKFLYERVPALLTGFRMKMVQTCDADGKTSCTKSAPGDEEATGSLLALPKGDGARKCASTLYTCTPKTAMVAKNAAQPSAEECAAMRNDGDGKEDSDSPFKASDYAIVAQCVIDTSVKATSPDSDTGLEQCRSIEISSDALMLGVIHQVQKLGGVLSNMSKKKDALMTKMKKKTKSMRRLLLMKDAAGKKGTAGTMAKVSKFLCGLRKKVRAKLGTPTIVRLTLCNVPISKPWSLTDWNTVDKKEDDAELLERWESWRRNDHSKHHRAGATRVASVNRALAETRAFAEEVETRAVAFIDEEQHASDSMSSRALAKALEMAASKLMRGRGVASWKKNGMLDALDELKKALMGAEKAGKGGNSKDWWSGVMDKCASMKTVIDKVKESQALVVKQRATKAECTDKLKSALKTCAILKDTASASCKAATKACGSAETTTKVEVKVKTSETTEKKEDTTGEKESSSVSENSGSEIDYYAESDDGDAPSFRAGLEVIDSQGRTVYSGVYNKGFTVDLKNALGGGLMQKFADMDGMPAILSQGLAQDWRFVLSKQKDGGYKFSMEMPKILDALRTIPPINSLLNKMDKTFGKGKFKFGLAVAPRGELEIFGASLKDLYDRLGVAEKFGMVMGKAKDMVNKVSEVSGLDSATGLGTAKGKANPVDKAVTAVSDAADKAAKFIADATQFLDDAEKKIKGTVTKYMDEFESKSVSGLTDAIAAVNKFLSAVQSRVSKTDMAEMVDDAIDSVKQALYATVKRATESDTGVLGEAAAFLKKLQGYVKTFKTFVAMVRICACMCLCDFPLL